MARRSNEELRKLAENRECHRGKAPDKWFEFPTSRVKAKRASLLYYFTGEPCQNQHIALRWSSNGGCLECAGYKDIPDTIKPYTKEEDEYLISNYQIQTKAQMAAALGRPIKGVEKHLLSVLNLSIDYKTRDAIRKANNNSENEKRRDRHRGNVPDYWFNLPSSQDKAIEVGSQYYFTGKPCGEGHINLRASSHRRCLACNREKSHSDALTEERKIWKREYVKQKHVKEKNRIYRKEAVANDPIFRLRINVSTRISNFFAGRISAGKQEKTEELLGCSYNDFHQWISNQLTDGMSMENYGLKGWHLDHVRPVMSFRNKGIDEKLEVQQVAFNWRNYQPLWGAENQSKNDDWTPQMETAWINRMRYWGWEGRLFLCFEDENDLTQRLIILN